jgi:hypothetical protein
LKKTGKVSFVCPFCCEENTCNEEKTIPIANQNTTTDETTKQNTKTQQQMKQPSKIPKHNNK